MTFTAVYRRRADPRSSQHVGRDGGEFQNHRVIDESRTSLSIRTCRTTEDAIRDLSTMGFGKERQSRPFQPL